MLKPYKRLLLYIFTNTLSDAKTSYEYSYLVLSIDLIVYDRNKVKFGFIEKSRKSINNMK